MGVVTLQCPECGVDVDMGLPRNATVKSVTVEPRSEPADEREKVRENVCENEHLFVVHFEY